MISEIIYKWNKKKVSFTKWCIWMPRWMQVSLSLNDGYDVDWLPESDSQSQMVDGDVECLPETDDISDVDVNQQVERWCVNVADFLSINQSSPCQDAHAAHKRCRGWLLDVYDVTSMKRDHWFRVLMMQTTRPMRSLRTCHCVQMAITRKKCKDVKLFTLK